MAEPAGQVPGRRHGQPQRLALPVGVEHRLVGLDLDRSEALQAAHVVNPVHGSDLST
jgi:hypothetical protein